MTDVPTGPDLPDVPGRGGQGASDDDRPGPAGLADLGGLLESAQAALSAQAQAAEQVVEGSAGGGVVTVEMTGGGEVRSVTLAPEVVDPDEIDMLQDLIVAALHDAARKVTELQRQALGPLGALDGLGLDGLGDMLRGGADPGESPESP
jgi:DNA-binding YbaB/EbfC family protein